MKSNLLHILFLFFVLPLLAQTNNDTISVQPDTQLIVQDTLKQKVAYDPLAPSKAAFYSAVLPGLGQAYNKKYWKIPIAYAGIGTGIYLHIRNNKDYNRFRDAYKRRLAGFTDDEFFGDGATPIISDDRLIDAQRSSQRNKDVSLIVAIAFYLVNIIDANVDAHLRQYNVSDDLSLTPNFEVDPVNTQPNYGLALKLKLQ